MILAIDAGNSRVKWGWYVYDMREEEANGKVGWSSVATVSLIEFAASSDHVNPFSATHENPARIIISNVAGEGAQQLLVNWTSIFESEPEWVKGEREACGVRNGYEAPEQLGPDRWAALIAARALEPGRACVVVNAGTATTVDALSAEGEFLGGLILPGVDLMRFVLHEHTGRLPLQEGRFVRTPRNTVDAIETGCRHAQAGAVERMHRVLGGDGVCLVSGGAGRSLIERLDLPCRYVENLVLEGLACIGRE
jgi:type III pantothenate kinase